jgi:hypothetical protein
MELMTETVTSASGPKAAGRAQSLRGPKADTRSDRVDGLNLLNGHHCLR